MNTATLSALDATPLNALNQLKQFTTVVADTGDIEAIKQFLPQDATTNPSLITAAAKQLIHQALIKNTLTECLNQSGSTHLTDAVLEQTIDILTVELGAQILSLIKGRVSTEVDAGLSFDTDATVAKAYEIIKQYAAHGIESDRVLIKIAATWQGIQAAKQLEQDGIHCNLTLLFGLHQAVACADANVTLISPFVGRILDWYKKAEGVDQYPIDKDPGVLSVKAIYQYYKNNHIPTEIMGASFRSINQVKALAGCDLLTIAPSLLKELEADFTPLTAMIATPTLNITAQNNTPITMDEQQFNEWHNKDMMANQLLASGITGFINARNELKTYLQQLN